MEKTVLIAGKPSNILHSLCGKYLDGGFQVSASSGSSEMTHESQESSFLEYHLNRRSPLANRSFVLNTLSSFSSIDEAVIIHTAEGDNRSLHEIPAAAIESAVDNSIKGLFFILKEIIAYFTKQEKGTLALVSYTYGLDSLTPVDAAAHGAFRELVNSLFTYYRNESVRILGFESQAPASDEFASFIFTTMREKGEKNHGKWFKYSERGNFLSNLPIPGNKRNS